MKRRVLPNYIMYLFCVFVSGMVLGTVFRLLLLSHFHHLDWFRGLPSHSLVYALFNRGLLYDAVVNAYIVSVPYILLSVAFFLNRKGRLVPRVATVYLILLYVILIIASVTDIPYFIQFNSRLTKGIFDWIDTPGFMVRSLFLTKDYYLYIVLALFASFLFTRWIILLHRSILLRTDDAEHSLPAGVMLSVFCAVLLLAAARGEWRPYKKPIGLKHAYFSGNAFVNQLGLNAAFNFVRSFEVFRIKYYADDGHAIRKAQEYLNVTPVFDSPVARRITFSERPRYHNVVIVLMESMSAELLEKYGGRKNLTPNLDSLLARSLVFDRFYTAGTHTYNAIFATLFSLPSVMKNKPLQTTESAGQTYAGISNTLKKNGYQTLFICTGDVNFDNMDSFLRLNDFDTVIGKDSYPRQSYANVWGVYDHVMFDNSLKILDQRAEAGKPFLAVYLTVSAHQWNKIKPVDGFKTSLTEEGDVRVQYADWAIGRFIDQASRKTWFPNTIFVFLADHGRNLSAISDMDISYFHSPLIIYAPGLIRPSAECSLALQVDVFPTLMGILKMPYINNTMGIDLRTETRPFAYFSSDDKIGIMDGRDYLVIRKGGDVSLYRIKNDRCNGQRDAIAGAREMEDYAYAMLQTTQWLISHRKVKLP